MASPLQPPVHFYMHFDKTSPVPVTGCREMGQMQPLPPRSSQSGGGEKNAKPRESSLPSPILAAHLHQAAGEGGPVHESWHQTKLQLSVFGNFCEPWSAQPQKSENLLWSQGGVGPSSFSSLKLTLFGFYKLDLPVLLYFMVQKY